MSPLREVLCFAPAKVNLRLALLGKRADGYHEIDTWMLALDWGDRLRVKRSATAGIRLRVHGAQASADIPSDERNLAFRAAALVLARAPAGSGLEIDLEKRVPSQAGLGAGSSDAAFAHWAAEQVLGLRSELERSQAELAQLGSDCVFFAAARHTGLAHCTSRGERVRPQTLPQGEIYVSVVAPSVACPTAAVYRAASCLSATRALPTVADIWFDNPIEVSRAALENDLEPAALAAIPELQAWRAALDAFGAAHYRLSGSGSSFFTLHKSAQAARDELAGLQRHLSAVGLVPRATQVARPYRLAD